MCLDMRTHAAKSRLAKSPYRRRFMSGAAAVSSSKQRSWSASVSFCRAITCRRKSSRKPARHPPICGFGRGLSIADDRVDAAIRNVGGHQPLASGRQRRATSPLSAATAAATSKSRNSERRRGPGRSARASSLVSCDRVGPAAPGNLAGIVGQAYNQARRGKRLDTVALISVCSCRESIGLLAPPSGSPHTIVTSLPSSATASSSRPIDIHERALTE